MKAATLAVGILKIFAPTVGACLAAGSGKLDSSVAHVVAEARALSLCSMTPACTTRNSSFLVLNFELRDRRATPTCRTSPVFFISCSSHFRPSPAFCTLLCALTGIKSIQLLDIVDEIIFLSCSPSDDRYRRVPLPECHRWGVYADGPISSIGRIHSLV